MKKLPPSFPAFLAVVLLISAVYLSGLARIPFHPDESTHVYTAQDVGDFLHDPSSQFWQAAKKADLRQKYRLLDSPLANYFIAAGLWIAGEKPSAVDWDWGKTWSENNKAGAFPTERVLFTSRAAVAILFPFSLIFLFLTAWRVANEFTAWSSALLLAGNALVLLHTRRAMAEGLLLFFSILAIWSLVNFEKDRWLTAVPAAFAFCAKQLLAPLLPLGLATACWPVNTNPGKPWRDILRQALFFGLAAAFLLTLFHPVIWRYPRQAVQAAIQSRQALAAAQTADRPDLALNTPASKAIAMIAALYLTPPVFAETGNYLAETQPAEEAYLHNPLHVLLRSIPAGASLLILNLFGFFTALLQAAKKTGVCQRRLVLVLAASLAQTIALLVTIPLPWQRYYLPLVPYGCLWIAFGIDQLRMGIAAALAVQRALR